MVAVICKAFFWLGIGHDGRALSRRSTRLIGLERGEHGLASLRCSLQDPSLIHGTVTRVTSCCGSFLTKPITCYLIHSFTRKFIGEIEHGVADQTMSGRLRDAQARADLFQCIASETMHLHRYPGAAGEAVECACETIECLIVVKFLFRGTWCLGQLPP